MGYQDRTDSSAMTDRPSDGWWGLALAAVILVDSAMVSLPTSASSVSRIQSFYDAHGTVIIVAQIIGLGSVILLVRFVMAVDRRLVPPMHSGPRWLLLAGAVVALAEFATNVPPLWLATLPRPSSGLARNLTRAEDLIDAALFAAIAAFAVVVAVYVKAMWLKFACVLVAVVTVAQALVAAWEFGDLSTYAGFGFLALVVVLSVLMLRSRAVVE